MSTLVNTNLAQKQSRNCASQRGFTLIETAVAMVVMMVAGLGVVSLFTYSIRYNSGAEDRAVAISIAQQQIEQLRSASFSDSLLNVTATDGVDLTPDTVSNGRSYRIRKTVIGSNNFSGSPTLKTITIQVSPLSPGWAGFPVTLTTVRSATISGTY